MIVEAIRSVGVHKELFSAAGVYVGWLCPALLFVHALLCKGKKSEIPWLAVTMPWCIVPINYILSVVVFIIFDESMRDYIRAVDPPYGEHVQTLVAAAVFTAMALLPGLPLWRGASSLMKAVRLQRYYIAAAMMVGLIFGGWHAGGDSPMYEILWWQTQLQVLTVLALLLACALRPMLARVSPRRVARLRRKWSAGRIWGIMAALYALVAVGAWQVALHERRAEQNARQHLKQNMGQYLQSATSCSIGYAFIYHLSARELLQVRQHLASLRWNPQGAPPEGYFAAKVNFGFDLPQPRLGGGVGLSLAHISPARSGDANVYTLPDADYDALLATLRPMVAESIRTTGEIKICRPGKNKKLSAAEMTEFKSLCAGLEWHAAAEFISHSYDAAVGSFEHELAFVHMVRPHLPHTIYWRDISPAGSGKNTPYTLPEAQYHRLYEWVRRVTATE